MKILVKTIWLALLMQFAAIGAAVAQEHGNADEAKALVQKAQAHIKAVGPAKAFEEFSAKDGNWTNKDLYVVALNFKGDVVAHGTNKVLIGKNNWDIKDANGVAFTQAMIEGGKSKGSGWQEYLFTNPVTKKIEHKASYYERIPGYEGVVLVGIYK